MIKEIHILIALLLINFINPSTCSAQENNNKESLKPTIDFLHFWVSKGELSALEIIKNEFIAKGGDWGDHKVNDYQLMKIEALMRLTKDFPPTAMLLLGGNDIKNMANLNVLQYNNHFISNKDWQSLVQPFSLNSLKIDSSEVGIPLTIHNENWAWYNLLIYQKLNLPIPKTWEEFLQQAPKIEKHGYLPIAVGEDNFSVRILFSVLLAGIGDATLYNRFYLNNDITALNESKFQKTLSIFAQLRRYSSKKNGLRNWLNATDEVIQGRAAMQIMGDWAKSEFMLGGKVLNKHFMCLPAPDAAKNFIAAVDVIVFPKVNSFQEKAGQKLLSEVILNESVQVNFANKKGSTPAIKKFDSTSLDLCAKSRLKQLSDKENLLFSPRLLTSQILETNIQDALAKFWKDPNMSEKMLTQNLATALKRDN